MDNENGIYFYKRNMKLIYFDILSQMSLVMADAR